jgi:hypothetical protein
MPAMSKDGRQVHEMVPGDAVERKLQQKAVMSPIAPGSKGIDHEYTHAAR